ncbi:MAG TPA: hypothetical protein VFF67_04595 [Thermoplasmata archaeon]|nr:hypothetical protein [Thermoplasmata archaeon]
MSPAGPLARYAAVLALVAAAVVLVPVGTTGFARGAALNSGLPNLRYHPWVNVSSTVAPTPRQGYSMAFDPALGVTVLFGGQDTLGRALGDTWELSGGHWKSLSLAKSPSARWAAGLVYNPQAKDLILFGGRLSGAGPSVNDTWKFTAHGWTQLALTHAPEPQGARTFVWDSTDGYALLIGSTPSAAGAPSVWTFSHGTWTNITSKVSSHLPLGLGWQAAADDAHDGYVLYFGGEMGYCSGLAVTWAYAHGQFTNLTGSQQAVPTAADGSAAMTYDGAVGGVVLQGGYTASCKATGQTWLFYNGHWSNITAKVGASIPGRWDARMTYDSTALHDVTFGGNEAPLGGNNYFIADTWTLRL